MIALRKNGAQVKATVALLLRLTSEQHPQVATLMIYQERNNLQVCKYPQLAVFQPFVVYVCMHNHHLSVLCTSVLRNAVHLQWWW
jgi:hypothetical protein